MLWSLLITLHAMGSTITVPVRPTENVYVLPALGNPGRKRIVIEGEAPGLCKLALAVPLPPGRWELVIEGPRGLDRTVVFSLPVSGGDYTFVVQARAKARFDFVLERGPGREYRAALIGPLRRRAFHAALP